MGEDKVIHVGGKGGVDPLILNSGTGWKLVVGFRAFHTRIH
jgi:hypothetical protein